MQIQSGFSMFPMSTPRTSNFASAPSAAESQDSFQRSEQEGTSMNEIFGRLILAQATSQNAPCGLQGGCQGPLL